MSKICSIPNIFLDISLEVFEFLFLYVRKKGVEFLDFGRSKGGYRNWKTGRPVEGHFGHVPSARSSPYGNSSGQN